MNSLFYTLRFALFAVLLIVVAACDTVEPSDTPDAPAVIPEAAFAVDLALFDAGSDVSASKSAEASNYLAAAIRVLVVNTGVRSMLFVPAAVTKAAQRVDPVWDGRAFVWAADTLYGDVAEGFALTARPEADAIFWEMRVTGNIPENDLRFDDFLLYEARTGLNSDEGTFDIYYPTHQGSLHALEGSYALTDDGSNNTLRFAIPREVPDAGGLEAIYGQQGPWLSLDVTEADPDKWHYMRWNHRTHEGSIEAYDYNNGEKACWNAALQNIDCPVGV